MFGASHAEHCLFAVARLLSAADALIGRDCTNTGCNCIRSFAEPVLFHTGVHAHPRRVYAIAEKEQCSKPAMELTSVTQGRRYRYGF
ncbi:hypothetical protein GQ54DRAFT_294774 [Martensiomyces pterosporus]|nr:hypothetical protein GQ54DRAFT_294774 [Martensiomyces pterosporus]